MQDAAQEPQVNPNKIFLGNLPFSLGEEDLRQMCEQFGQIVEVVLITQYHTGRSKGFGFVEFDNEESAQAAIEALNESEIEGRTIYVKIAQPPKPRRERSFGGGRGRRDDRGFRGRDRGNSRGPRDFQDDRAA